MVEGPLQPFDAGKPSVARLHDYALGGKDNFTVDREAATELEKIFPLATALARESREFLARAVGYVARQGVSQFIDVGSGYPTSPATHEIAGPQARVAYVDNDPVVISHAAARLAWPGHVAAVPGDAQHPGEILASPALLSVIDTGRPFCVIMATILDFFEPAQAAAIAAEFRDAMPAGSFLVLCIGINNDPDLAQEWIEAYRAARVHLHRREQIAGYLAGLELVEPGLTTARHWRSPHPSPDDDPRPADLAVAVGRKGLTPRTGT